MGLYEIKEFVLSKNIDYFQKYRKAEKVKLSNIDPREGSPSQILIQLNSLHAKVLA